MCAGNEISSVIHAGMQSHLLCLLNKVVSKRTLLARVAGNGEHIVEKRNFVAGIVDGRVPYPYPMATARVAGTIYRWDRGVVYGRDGACPRPGVDAGRDPGHM